MLVFTFYFFVVIMLLLPVEKLSEHNLLHQHAFVE